MEDINSIIEEKEINESEFFETIKSIVYSSIGIFIFFIPINIDGYTTTFLYHIILKVQGEYIHLLKLIIVVFLALDCASSIIKKSHNKIKIILKLISLLVIVNIFYGSKNIFTISDNTIFLIEENILNISTIIPFTSIFMVFLLEYGLIDIIESYCHKFMKNTYKMSGKTIINILVFLFTDVFCGYFITNYMYKQGKLREGEFVMLITNFSVASIWTLNYVCNELDINKFVLTMLSLIVIAVVNLIMCRIYPLNKKKKTYLIKTNYKETLHKKDKFKKGMNKYLKNNIRKNIFKEILSNLEESFHIIINLIPAIIIVFILGDIVYRSSLITASFTYILNPLFSMLKLTDCESIANFVSTVIYNNITAIEGVLSSIDNTTKLILGMITMIGCISVSTNIIYIKLTNINISLKELIIIFVERIILIIIIYCLFSYTIIGYFI